TDVGDWTPLKTTVTPAGYAFAAPAGRMVAALLLARAEPIIHIQSITPTPPGETGVARVAVTWLGAETLHGTVGMAMPKGWTCRPAACEIYPGKTASFAIPFTVASNAAFDVHDVHAAVKAGEQTTKRCAMMGVCRPVQASLDWINHTTIQLSARNVSSKPVDADVKLILPSPAQTQAVKAPVRIEAGQTWTHVYELATAQGVLTREDVRAELAYGGITSAAHELMQPPLINGGFEQCSAHDGQPDYWGYRVPAPARPVPMLDTDQHVEGKQSLRIDPLPGIKTNYMRTSMLYLLPDTTYRLRLAVRRSANHPGIYIHLMNHHATNGKFSTVNVVLGSETTAPVNTWKHYEKVFTTTNVVTPFTLILINNSEGAATVWFDDVSIEPVETDHP
ncbi:MAG: hypothetical protein IT440_09625, partial [Phycisphaeraceae bacterium]|nr:hypothetical protein [Phycisphaeraceae bacterium]